MTVPLTSTHRSGFIVDSVPTAHVDEPATDVAWASVLSPERVEPSTGAGRVGRSLYGRGMVTLADVRAVALTLPRSYEALVRGRVKFRVGRIVYLACSRDESLLGFAFPKEWREALVASEPHKFMLPRPSDLRYNWAVVRLEALDEQELRELVVDAWALVVPKSVAAAYAEANEV
jgi:hypothetical protein